MVRVSVISFIQCLVLSICCHILLWCRVQFIYSCSFIQLVIRPQLLKIKLCFSNRICCILYRVICSLLFGEWSREYFVYRSAYKRCRGSFCLFSAGNVSLYGCSLSVSSSIYEVSVLISVIRYVAFLISACLVVYHDIRTYIYIYIFIYLCIYIYVCVVCLCLYY